MTRACMSSIFVGLTLIAAGCGGGTTRSGSVSLANSESGGTSTHVLTGAFLDAPIDEVLAGNLPGCEVQARAGDCEIIRCAGASPTFFNAGTITASVAGTELLSASPGASGGYNATGTGPAFTAGQVVSFTATGGAVPAFAGSVTAPETPTVTLPAAIQSGADLVVTWPSTLAAEQAIFVLVSSGTLLSCRVPASQGTITIASTLLTNVGPGAANIALAGVNSTRLTAGEYTIDLNATAGTAVSAVVQ